MTDLYQTWRAGKVNRMHTMPQLIRENVAEHTWGVYLLMLMFYPEATRQMRDAIILHDAGEIAVGDIPAHVKWANPEIAKVVEDKENRFILDAGLPVIKLLSHEQWLLEIFDRTEFCLSCLHEMRMGNHNASEYFVRSAGRVGKLALTLKQEGYNIEYDIALKVIEVMEELTNKYLQHMGTTNVFSQ